jgi:hypothetical protein
MLGLGPSIHVFLFSFKTRRCSAFAEHDKEKLADGNRREILDREIDRIGDVALGVRVVM